MGIEVLAEMIALCTRYTKEEYQKLAQVTHLPFDLNKVVEAGEDVVGAIVQLEHDHRFHIQELMVLRNLRQFLFVKPLVEMPEYVDDYFYLYRDIARWRITLNK